MQLIRYKCKCMPVELEIEVPTRPPGSDILIWMGVVTYTIGMDHTARSPRCMAVEIEYAKIPVEDGAEGIGEKPRMHS